MEACDACRAFVAAAPPCGWIERRRLSSDTSMPRPRWLRCTVTSKSMWWSRKASVPEGVPEGVSSEAAPPAASVHVTDQACTLSQLRVRPGDERWP